MFDQVGQDRHDDAETHRIDEHGQQHETRRASFQGGVHRHRGRPCQPTALLSMFFAGLRRNIMIGFTLAFDRFALAYHADILGSRQNAE